MDRDDRMSRKALLSSLQYLWRLAIPFWMFRDAGHGTAEQRIANYRYNRAQRKVLPFYMGKWVGIAICLLQLTRILSGIMSEGAARSTDHAWATFLCVSAGIGFAFACVVLAVLSASYLYLTWVEH